MKRKIFFAILLALATAFNLFAQDSKQKLPGIDVKNLKGETVNTSSLSNEGKPMIISFWATWCKPCVLELSTINDLYTDWQKETGVKLIAVSIDDSRNTPKVSPFVNGKGWDYEVYLDPNGDFKRALNVNNVPHTFLLDNTGEIVWQHNSFSPGDEEELYELVKKVAKGEKITK